MKTIVATNDSSLATKLAHALLKMGIECPPSQRVSLESVRSALGAANAGPTVVFFGSSQFTEADFALLKQLCTGQEAQVKVVAIGPATNPNLILQAIHCGAGDFLDIKGDFETELRSLISRLKASGSDVPTNGRLFVVLPVAGGAGASSLAINLAAAIARKQSESCLLDLCLRGGDLATLLKLKPRYTLLSLASKAQQVDRAMFDQSLIRHDCGVYLLASPEPFSDFRQINPPLVQQVVQFARARFANVVAELEDMEHAEQVRTLAQADRIIVPLRLDFVALSRARICIDLLCANVPRDRITLVACSVGQPNELPADRFTEVLGLPVEHRIKYDPAAMNAAVNLGMPLVAATPNAKASQGIIALTDALIGTNEPVQTKRKRITLKSAVNLFRMATT